MESESQSSLAAQHAGILSLSLGAYLQAETENFPGDSLNLQLNSWDQAMQQASFDRDKANHGSSLLESAACRGRDNVTSSLFQNAANSMEGLNTTVQEEVVSLTLGFSTAFARRLSPSRCEGRIHETAMCISGDDRRHINVDLGLSLAANQECHSTIAPFPTQVAIAEAGTKMSEGWQKSACGVTVHGGGHVPPARKNEKNSSLHEGLFGNVPHRNTKEIDLQLGLSGSSLSLDSDSVSVDGGQEARVEAFTYEHIRVVDEGSTSAKLMESGGNYVPFLGCKLNIESPSSVQSQACMLPGGPSEVDTVKLPSPSPAQEENLGLVSALEKSRKASFGGFTASGTFHGYGATSNANTPISERATKKCKFKGCSKGARGASGLCIAHGGGRRCQKLNCSKGAEGRTMFCKAHGGGRRCQSLGCVKSAEGRTDFCIAHGGGRRCMYDGCSKAARGRSGLCIRHGGGKRCQREGCTKSAEGFSGLCISHGGGRRCQFPDCGKGAQGSTKFCKGHGGGRRCEFEGCTKGAEGSTPFCKAHGGGKRCTFGGGICTKSVHGGTAFCVAHGGGKRCSVQGCTKSARGRTDYCVRHGGGKRCKFEHCNKSAQGSTDYCKAHGGGKRCLWGQEGSVYDGSMLEEAFLHGLQASCEKFARGKAGLCSSHINLLEQYHPGLVSIPNLQGTSSEQNFSKQYLQQYSDTSESTSQLDEEPDSMVEDQVKSVREGSWTQQEQLSSPVLSKAQYASGRGLLTGASQQNMGDGCGLGKSCPEERSTVKVPGLHLSLCNRDVNPGCFPSEHMLQTSQPCLQRDFAPPFSGLQMTMACSDSLRQVADSMGHTFRSEDPEERVHGGGHFMAFCTKKT